MTVTTVSVYGMGPNSNTDLKCGFLTFFFFLRFFQADWTNAETVV